MALTGLNLISLNVRGLRERGKRKSILEWCRHKKSDILFFQETYSTQEVETRWKLELGGNAYFSHGTNHSRGVLVSIAPTLNIKVIDLKIDEGGRYIILKVDIRGTKILLGNFYFPTRDKEKEQIQFLKDVEKIISEMWSQEYELVLGGDFNLIMDKKIGLYGVK